ncbi:ABC-three component system protein [Roseomonas sp. BN140053]|uniref:ABC-three component system protein n=1 Tax=Roseomonas sp. BN140053 TaxID=3391898 RepID=UPI0039EC7E63
MDADEIDWAWQEMHLHVRLRDSDGDAFETLFQDIGKALWGTAFYSTIPMGSRGDLKCDGWRSDVGHVYQCYGPRYGQADVRDALKKVEEDFRGAKDHWKDLLKKWWFVVGLYRDKVPSEVARLMAELTNELKVPSGVLHRGDIVDLARGIEAGLRAKMFGGRAPGSGDMNRRATYENIGRALAYIRSDISRLPLEPILLPTAVDAKVAFNLLPDSVRHFFGISTAAARRVEKYIDDRADPDEGARMAAGFTSRYQQLRSEGAEPTEAFKQLLIFAGGATGDPDREVAALAIVTHFFSTCQIFDQPPEVGHDPA